MTRFPEAFRFCGTLFLYPYGCPDLTRYVGSKPDWKLPHVLGLHTEHSDNWAKCSIEPHLKNVKGTGMAIWFGCGVRDELLPDNRKLSDQTKAMGNEHTYYEGPSGHNSQFASVGFQECMKALEKNLRRQ